MEDRNYQAPESHWPQVRYSRSERGREAGSISDRVIGPDGLRWAEGMTVASSVMASIALLWLLIALGPPAQLWFVAYGIAFILFFPMRRAWMDGYSTDFHFRFTQTDFQCGDAQPYDLRIPHSFDMRPHYLAEAEARDIEFKIRNAQHNRQCINPKRYYGDSYHIVFSYHGCSKFLLTVYGREDARAILEKLQYLDQRFTRPARGGGRRGHKPEDQWGDSASGLPG